MNKYLEKIAERDLKQDAQEVATATAIGGGVGGYFGKVKHEAQMHNLKRSATGRGLSPLMDKAFKKQHIVHGAMRGAAITGGISAIGHLLAGNKKEEK